MKHNRQYCFYCGGKLNFHEWLYGACSDCMKRRGKAAHWKPRGRSGENEIGWFWTDNAPRSKEFIDYHDFDDEGVIRIMEAIFGNIHHYPDRDADGRTPPPPGTRRCIQCHKLIPAGGLATCPDCLAKHKIYMDAKRAKRIQNHECTACGAKLPEGWPNKCCDSCLTKYKTHNIQSRQKQEARA